MQKPHTDVHDRAHDHDRGLAHDLMVMSGLIERRRALKWFAGAGTAALVAGCGGSDASVAATSEASAAAATPTPTPTPTTTSTATSASTVTGCVSDPTETNGPYPADGTNVSSGLTSNALTVSGIVRGDIRSSFMGTATAIAPGVPLTLTLTVVNVNSSCAPLAGYAVYVWHCNARGQYSLYDLPSESYLRGVGVTDANGQVTFTTIVPGCYDGRYPHIHFEVFSSLATATGGRYAALISQLAIPAAMCSAVYADTATYANGATNFARVSISSDNVFGDNSSAQIAQQTPAFSGSVAAGYTANAVIGLAR